VKTSLQLTIAAAIVQGGVAITLVYRRIAIQLSRNALLPADWQKVGWSCLSLTGGVLLIAIGVMLWCSAQPETSGGIRPMFLN